MKILIILVLFTFPLLLIIAFMVRSRRRRLRVANHDLTRLRHKDGGKGCGNCSEKPPPPDSSNI
jgi:hypothetical protein